MEGGIKSLREMTIFTTHTIWDWVEQKRKAKEKEEQTLGIKKNKREIVEDRFMLSEENFDMASKFLFPILEKFKSPRIQIVSFQQTFNRQSSQNFAIFTLHCLGELQLCNVYCERALNGNPPWNDKIRCYQVMLVRKELQYKVDEGEEEIEKV